MLQVAYSGVVQIDFCQIPLTWYLFWGSVRASKVLENLRNERIGIRAFQKIKNYRKRFTELGERAAQRPSVGDVDILDSDRNNQKSSNFCPEY